MKPFAAFLVVPSLAVVLSLGLSFGAQDEGKDPKKGTPGEKKTPAGKKKDGKKSGGKGEPKKAEPKEEPKKEEPKYDPSEKKRLDTIYFGIKACARCHTDGAQKGDLSRCTEVKIWQAEDKHKDANKVLKGERGKQMGDILGIKDVSTDARCVSCHGILVEPPAKVDSSYSLAEGVNCSVCHGPHKEWIYKHGSDFEEDRKAWRAMSRQEKENHWGMIDLWDPVRRAELCLSCHVGNVAEKKVVTHEFYAAGHPPLPGIEVNAFCDQMPRHWELIAEKPASVQKMLGFVPGKSNLEQTELMVISGVVAFRNTLQLIAHQAREGKKPEAANPWPELAAFDCYACHHDLKYPGWRQERGYGARVPGRPGMRPWSTVLVEVGIQHAARGDAARVKALHKEMHDALIGLDKAFSARPFGHPDQVIAAADRAAGWADRLLKQVQDPGNRFDKAAAKKLLLDLNAVSDRSLLDFDSARQLLWAYGTLKDEGWKSLNDDPQVAKWWNTFDRRLELTLPKGQKSIAETKLDEGKTFLAETLDSLNAYDPRRFRTDFGQLMKAVRQAK